MVKLVAKLIKEDYLILEPIQLSVDMEHDLNVIKEITVTDSFLSLDKDIRGCQEESFDECTARNFKNTLMNKCQCLPFQLGLSEVSNKPVMM